MKIIILTSSLYGTASHHLEYLVGNPGIDIRMVVFSEGQMVHKKKKVLRKIAKLFKIGILGAINGVRMRKWYNSDLEKYVRIENLESKCRKLNIPFSRTPFIGSRKTQELFKSEDADLGISLGNGYIPESIFSIPEFGMINIHHEILPDYQNAQSIIWQLYNGSSQTGYTIHKIDRHIDTGEILLQERIPVSFRETFADTVTYTYSELLKSSAKGLAKLLANFQGYLSESSPQGTGKNYTTPTLRQYLKMVRQFGKLKNGQKENTGRHIVN